MYGLKKRVLVSGGAGFLGSHLCERLIADGCEVVCVDNYFTGTRDNIRGPLADGLKETIGYFLMMVG